MVLSVDTSGVLCAAFDHEFQAAHASVDRQLQELSDSVVEVETSAGETIQGAALASATLIGGLEQAITRSLSKHRYLAYLKLQQSDEDMDEEDKCCVLCKCEFAKVCLYLDAFASKLLLILNGMDVTRDL